MIEIHEYPCELSRLILEIVSDYRPLKRQRWMDDEAKFEVSVVWPVEVQDRLASDLMAVLQDNWIQRSVSPERYISHDCCSPSI